ncbi:hypothetical protein [Streptomyces microflavus]|uniref:hypothetical protein n=1 Tax=Streptomyces microflavus TaxID=1919 RepID=UPI003B20E27F
MIERAPVTMAFSALLATATGIPVGRGRKPAGNHHRYYLLHSITATYSGAPFSDLNEDASFIYQLTPFPVRTRNAPTRTALPTKPSGWPTRPARWRTGAIR